jgi:hypothetical protein
MRSLSCSGTPAPWSVTLSVALPPCIRTSTSTGGAPCRSALIHRRLSHPRRCNHQASDEGRRGRRSRDGTPEDRGSTLPSFGLGQDVSADAKAAGRSLAFWRREGHALVTLGVPRIADLSLGKACARRRSRGKLSG